MLVDKNGKEITAGCKILVGETVFKVWGDAPVNHKSSPKSGHKE